MTRDCVKIAAKLYECQETAKSLFKGEYKERIQWYKDAIVAISEKHQLPTLKAVIQICENERIKGNGMALMMFMAAAVEIVESPKQ